MKHIFDKCKSVVAKFAKGGELTEVYGRFSADSKALLSDINEALYDALNELLMSHISNEGTVDFSEKDYSYISDDLDIIAIKYKDEGADGSTFQEELENDGEPMLSDEGAYMVLTTRFENTYIDTDDLTFKEGEKSIKDVNSKLRGALIITLKAYSNIGYSKDARSYSSFLVYDSAKSLLAEINSGKLTDGEVYTKLTEFFCDELYGALDKIKKFEAGGTVDTTDNVWDFVQKFYPDYYSSDDIAYNDDLHKIVAKEEEEGDDAYDILHDDFGGSRKKVKAAMLESNEEIFEGAIDGFVDESIEEGITTVDEFIAKYNPKKKEPLYSKAIDGFLAQNDLKKFA